MRAHGLMLAMCCACADERSLWLDLPPIEGKQALVIATPGEVRAYDLVEGTADLKIDVPVLALASGEIEALLYEETLDQLALVEGPLSPSTDRDDLALPPAVEIYRAAIDLELPSASWTEANTLSRATEDFRYSDEQRCAAFDRAVGHELETTTAHWAVRIDDDSVLAGTSTGTLLVERERVRLLDWGGYAKSAMRLPNREILLGDSRGYVYRATVTRAEGITGANIWGGELRPNYPVISIAGEVRSDLSYELYALSGDEVRVMTPRGYDVHGIQPHLFRNTGDGWISLGPLGDRATGNTVGELVYAGDSEVLVLGTEDGALFSIKNGVISRSVVDNVSLTSLDLAKGVGLVAGSGQGDIYRRNGVKWENLIDDDSGWWVMSVLGFRRGVLFLSGSGLAFELDARRRICMEVANLSYVSAGGLFELSAREVFVWGTNAGTTKFQFMPRVFE